MPTTEQRGPQTVVLCGDDYALIREVETQFKHSLQEVALSKVQSPEESNHIVAEKGGKIIILLYEHLKPEHLLFIRQLKLGECDPGIIVLADFDKPAQVVEFYEAGSDRCILKTSLWQDELPPAVRHLLRLKRLQDENLAIRARLTETNHLLEEKNKRLDEFSMTVAHDIRGPLGGICMKLEYVLDTYKNQLEGRVYELLNRSYHSSQRLMHIVQAMYEYARLGSKATAMIEVSLSKVVKEVIEDLNVGNEIDVQIGIADLPVVWGNPELLRRVFLNLISNSIKYNDKPEIVVNIGTTGLVDRALARYCEVFVSDNGPGITEEEKREIFCMFRRGSNGACKKEGLGIGLAVVQRIIELHHGEVKLESIFGKGSTFILSLPLEQGGLLDS